MRRNKNGLALGTVLVMALLLGAIVSIMVAAPTGEAAAAPTNQQINAVTSLLSEDFEGSFPPTGWSVVDNAGSGNVWARNDTLGVPNETGGSGYSAAADTGGAACGTGWDTELWSPAIDLSLAVTASLSYESNFQDFASYGEIWLDVSTDGGSTWDNLRNQTADDPSGGTSETEDLAAYVGETIHLRWRYTDDNYSDCAWFWHIDDVEVQADLLQYATLTPGSLSGAACQLSDVVYNLEVGNISGSTDTINLSLQGNRWPTTIEPTSIVLADGETTPVTVTVSIPNYAFDGEVDSVIVEAATATDPDTPSVSTIETTAGSVWTPGAAADSALWPAFASDGSAIYYFDGVDDGGSATDQTQIFDASAGWSMGAGHGYGNFYGGVAGYHATDDLIYYAPGFVDGMTAVDAFVTYDPNTDTFTDTLAARPEALGLGGGGVTASGAFVWVGGSPDSGLLNYTPVYIYNPLSDAWTAGATLTDVGFTASGYAVIGDTVYVGGNYLGSSAFYAYDVTADTWTQLADLPAEAGKIAPLLVYDGVDIFLIGGGDSPTIASDTTWRYDIAGDTWEPFATLNEATMGSGGGALGGMPFTYGGGADLNVASAPAPHEYAMSQCAPITTAEISGQVTNGVSGDPIEGAMVEALGTGEVTLLVDTTPMAYTDENGFYTLTVADGAYYDVTASYGDFASITENVAVNGNATQDFLLGPPVSNPSETSFSVTIPWGTSVTETMTVANDGYSDLAFEFIEGASGGPSLAMPLSKLDQGHTLEVIPHEKGEFAADRVTEESPEDIDPGEASAIGLASTSFVPQGVIYDNGSLVTHPGGGASGYDASALQTGLGLGSFGLGHQYSLGFRIADDFTLDGPANIETITFFAYQSFAGPPSTITGVYLQIWDGPPNDPASNLIFGDLTTNRLVNTTWSEIYRVLDTDLTATDRPIMANTVEVGMDLPAGTYWLDWTTDGSASSGPWAPFISILGETTTGNALQYTGSWGDALDGSYQQGFPFIIEGSGSDISWLSEDPITGTVPLQNNVDADLIFDAVNVPSLGTYTGTLTLDTNDPNNPQIDMSVEMIVVDNANAGKIEGAITGDRPGGPLEGAEVHLEAASGYTATLTTDANGYYEQRILPADLGTFTVTVSMIDYLSDITVVNVTAPGPTVHDVELVYDGPEIMVTPDAFTFNLTWGDVATDSLDIHNLGVQDLDFDLDLAPLAFADFEDDFPPEGWIVANNGGDCVWTTTAETGRSNYAGGDGIAATADSDWCGSGTSTDTEMWMPPLDLTGVGADVKLAFTAAYNDLIDGGDFFAVYVSPDGGSSWDTLLVWDEDHNPYGPGEYVELDLTPYAWSSEVIISFHYVAGWDWWIQLDEIGVYPQADWLGWTPDTGAVISGTNETISITADTTMIDTPPGTFVAGVRVNHNDGLQGPINVPITLTLASNPDQGYLSGTVTGNRTLAGMDMPLENALVEVWDGTNYYSRMTDDTGFYELYLLPDALGTYTVTVSANDYLTDTDTAVINTGDSITHDVALTLESPYLNADPEAISESLSWGGNVDLTLTISNPLPANQELNVHMFELAGSYTPPTVQTTQVTVPATTASVDAAMADAFAPAHTQAARVHDVVVNNLALDEISVLIVSSDWASNQSVGGLDAVLNAYPDIQADVYPMQQEPTLEELLPYPVVIIGNQVTWESTFSHDLMGDVMADYVDAGGKVIQLFGTMHGAPSGGGFYWGLGGRWEAEGYSPMTYSTDFTLFETRTLGVYNAAHPLMANVDYIEDNFVYGNDITVKADAEAVAYYDNGLPYLAAYPMQIVAINQALTDAADWDGDVPTLLHNAILYLAPQDVPWLSETVTDFNLTVGDAATSTISLDSSAPEVEQPGTYTAWLWLHNNDKLQQGAYIPVEMDVQVDATMGELGGQITLNRHESGMGAPAADATIVFSSTAGIREVDANANGEYVYFFQAAELPGDIEIIASHEDYRDSSATVTLNSGQTIITDLELELDAPWIQVEPISVEVTVAAGTSYTDTFLTIDNFGLQDLAFDILELPSGSVMGGTDADVDNVIWVDDPFTVDAEVTADLQADGRGDFFIWMRERADLSHAYTMANIDLRREYVYETLLDTAERSQAEITAYLDSQGIEYEVFWINNSILVRDGDQATLDFVSAREDVVRIRGVYTQMSVPDPDQLAIVTPDENAILADPTWNIDIVDADEVWAQLGITGEDAVVANIDTGVRYTHEALVDSYRGNLGGGVFDHDYNWGSIYGGGPTACPDSATAPCDWSGHGTHTAGTMVGGDGEGPFDMDIGVAPDAEWMACMGCDTPPNSCSDAALTGCAQWMVAPLDLNGNNPDPTMAPDVVNNSWGGGGEDPWYYSYVEAWNAANIIPVFSAGNSGPTCDTLGSPGSYDNVIGVGGTDSSDFNYASTSRGPGSGTGVFPIQKPDIAAPGEGVPSAVQTGDDAYASYSGTSMAAPHVSGLTALLRSVVPDLDRQTIWNIITTSAVTDTLDIKNGAWCGAGPGFPNHVFGHGRIDAMASVEMALTQLDIPWLVVTPETGVVIPSDTAAIDLGFHAMDMPAGVYTGTLSFSHNDPLGGEIEILVTMNVVSHAVSLTPTVDSQVGLPGEMVTYTLTLTNDGTIADTFDLAADGNDWTVDLPVTSVTLDPGESTAVIVNVMVPAGAMANASDMVTITATSQTDASVSASSVLTTLADIVYSMSMTADLYDLSGAPGETVTATITMTNTGNITDTYTMAMAHDWPAMLDHPMEATMAAGESATMHLMVTIPMTATDGMSDAIVMSVTSAGDPDMLVEVTFNVTAVVEDYLIHLPLISRP